MKLMPHKSKIPPTHAPLMPTNGTTPHSCTLNQVNYLLSFIQFLTLHFYQTIRSKIKTPVFCGMSPMSPRQPEPVIPRITLNLRDDPIPASYRKSAQLGDNGTSDEDEPMYEDNDIQELEKCGLNILFIPFN